MKPLTQLDQEVARLLKVEHEEWNVDRGWLALV